MEPKQEKSKSEGPLHPMQYKVRSGTRDSGKEYEKKMLTIFALRCALGDEENSWIATNAPNVGAFDDVVLHYGHITFLVQLKHKENTKPVTKEAFKGEKGDFSLIKYYKDISSLKKALDSDNDKQEFVRYLNAFDKLYFILFTNMDVIDYDLFKESNEQALQFLNTSIKGKILKTVMDKLPGIVNLNNVDSKDIYLFANQTSVKHTDHQIQEIIKNITCKFNLAHTNVKTVAKQFTNYVSDWAEGKFGGYYCLSKTEILKKLSEILLGQYQIELSKETLFGIGTDTQIAIWKQLMDNNALTLFNYEQSVIQFLINYISKEVFKYCGENISSWLCNFSTSAQSTFYENHKTLKSHMLRIVSNRGKITAEDIYKCLWLTGELPVLLVIKNKEDYSDILKILKLCGYCYKVILINTSEEEIHLQKCENAVKQFFSLEDLNETDKNNLLQLTVTLQKRSSAPLQHFVDKRFFYLIKCNDIVNILLDNYNIGNDFEPLPDYFIEREVSKVLIKSEVLEQVKDEKFIIQGDYKIMKIKNSNVVKWEDFDFSTVEERGITGSDQDFTEKSKPHIEQRKRQPVHHLKVYDKHHFEWKASYGSTKNIKQFVVDLEDSFENNIIEKLSSRLILLSGPPGIGKSILMNYIACNVPPTKWVLKIDLNLYMDYCRKHKVKILYLKPSEYVKHLYKFSFDQSAIITTTLTHKIFQKLGSFKDIIFLLDAFDEISILYKKEITGIIKSLYNEGFHICITTRPHMESHLEEQLNVFSISLKSFSQEDQEQFLTKYFISQNKDISLNLRQRYVTEFSKKLLHTTKKNLSDMDSSFTGIPLQCKLLAEVFNMDYREFTLSKGTFIFNENFDLLLLYRNFIKCKMDILSNKSRGYSEKTLMLLNNLQSLLALKLIFPLHKDIITYVEKYSKCHYTNQSNEILVLQEGGILTVDKNFNISFVHRTFAEYLVAEWLAENFNSPDHNLRDYVKLLMNERFSLNYKFLFIMFDRIVAENCPLHLNIINGETSNVIKSINSNPDYVSITDKCNRSLLHMTALYGTKYPSLYDDCYQTEESKNFLSSETYNTDSMLYIIDNIPADRMSTSELDLFGCTPLDYALAYFSLTIANRLYTKIKITSINAIINLNRKRDYLGYCALLYYEELFKTLLVYFATKDFFLNQVYKNESVQSYFHRMFADYDYQYKIGTYFDVSNNKTVKRLVLSEGKKIFPNLTNCRNDLHICIIFSFKEDACRLIEQGIEINTRDNDYNTPLHYAVLHKNTQITEILLSNGASVSLQNSNGNTPLHLALLYNNRHLAELLISNNSDAKLENKEGQNALHLASCQGYYNIVPKLLSSDVDIHKQDNTGATPLYCAVYNNRLHTAKLLMSKSANPNTQNKLGYNCLHAASSEGNIFIAFELLPKIKDINQQNNKGSTSLQIAVNKNKLDLVRLLISKDADANISNKFGWNCLHTASYKGHTGVAFEILNKIKDINQQDIDGFTSLQLAVQENSLDLVRFLISKGADANISNKSGHNCLHTASFESNTDIASEILNKIKDINQQDNDGFTSLQVAVQQNKLDLVRFLISKGADANISNKFGWNCLHIASYKGHADIASEILNKIKYINQRDNDGFTSLQFAVQENKLDVVRFLISKDADANILNEFGQNCLHAASCNGHTDIASEILNKIKDINQRDNDGFTSLQFAVQENKLDVVRFLVSKGADANISNKIGRNCLHRASYEGYTDIASEILNKIKDINQQDNDGFTSLYLAAQENKLDLVRFLISKGADANISNKFGRNCLHAASYNGHTAIASEILNKLKDINQQDNDGFTSLQFAVQENKLDLVRFLISKGADANIFNKFGLNCLHAASYKGNTAIASAILNKIKDINQQDNDGFTPLELAVHENRLGLVRFLISKGGDPNIPNKSGWNCLHTASYRGHTGVASEILNKIRDINQQDNDGFTSLQLAVQENKLDLVRFLISKDADANISNKSGCNCLHTASFERHIDIASEILNKIKNINQQDNDGFTSLQLAVQENSLDLVRFLISKGGDPNIPNKSGWNCLHTASYRGHANIASEILHKIKDINQQDNDGDTSLQLAVKENKLDLVRFLISKDADANISNEFGQNCLHAASCNGHTDIASEILNKIKDINQRDSDGFTPLELAVHENKLGLVRFLISKGGDPNIPNKSGWNCLHTASYRGHTDITSEIFPTIKNINRQNHDYFTSLHLAVLENKLETVKFLISKGAALSIPEKGVESCFHLACYYGNTNIALEILPAIEDINEQDSLGFTSIHLAVLENKLDTVKLLVSNGASVNTANKNGENCLHLASYYGYSEVVSEILPTIEDVNQQDYEGYSSLQLAVEQYELEVARLLISEGASVNILNKDGENCLHLASYHGFTNMVSEIISKIKDINQQNNDGFTSLHLAVLQNNLDIVKVLISNGASVNIPNKDGESCLHLASFYGYNDIVYELLLINVNINQTDSDGDTPLHNAILLNKFNVAKLLISKGADLSIINKSGLNPVELLVTELATAEFFRALQESSHN